MSAVERVRGRYATVVAIALLGLCPNVMLSTAFLPLQDLIASDLSARATGVDVAQGMGNAAYAVGAVIAAQVAQRFGQRPFFLGYQATFVLASLVTASATALPWFLVGRVGQGLAAGAMLISALPPLVTRFGAARLPLTVVIVDVGMFGAATLGPIVGGVVAASGSWRALMVWLAVAAVLGLAVAWAGYPRLDPVDVTVPIDRAALLLSTAATVLIFFATSYLSGASLTSPWVLGPLLGGLAALGALAAVERRKVKPLMPIGVLTTQLPVSGMVVALVGGAVFVTVLGLLQTYSMQVAGLSPSATGWAFWPMPMGMLVAASAFGLLFRTRYVPVLANTGLAALVVAALVPLTISPVRAAAVVGVASAFLGFGAGATVSPGLFMCGLGLPSKALGRAFALVQLLRSVATYAVVPVVIFAVGEAAALSAGVKGGLIAMALLSAVGLVVALGLPALSGARLRAPDLDAWLEGGQALPSPATGVHLRPGVEDEQAEPLLPRRLRRDV
jgi:MFS family permease